MSGGWIHLDQRKLMRPPEDLVEVLKRLDQTPDWEELAPMPKRRSAAGG
jgi:hypothetical protein